MSLAVYQTDATPQRGNFHPGRWLDFPLSAASHMCSPEAWKLSGVTAVGLREERRGASQGPWVGGMAQGHPVTESHPGLVSSPQTSVRWLPGRLIVLQIEREPRQPHWGSGESHPDSWPQQVFFPLQARDYLPHPPARTVHGSTAQ